MTSIHITTPNQKGQIVIPKKIRDALGITASTPLQIKQIGDGILLQPLEEIVTKVEQNIAFSKLLEKTRGAWHNDYDEKLEKKRRKMELEASKKRKQSW